MSKFRENKMRAMTIDFTAGAGVLHYSELPVPKPAAGELLVKVSATGVNRADIILLDPDTPLPLVDRPATPGLEVCGEVVALGDGVEDFRPGDRVAALSPSAGGYAEYCCVPASLAWSVPGSLGALAAAALPEALVTLWNALFRNADTNHGTSLLVHGGSSGVGSMAIKLAHMLGGFDTILATAGSQEKCEAMQTWGVHRAINYRTEDFADAVREETGGLGAEVILDMVGGAYIERNIGAAARRGRIVQMGMMGGNKGTVDIAQLMAKQVTLRGATIWFQTVKEKAVLAAEIRERVWPQVAIGNLQPVLDSVFPLGRASEAMERMQSSAHIGKILLSPTSSDVELLN